MMVRAEKSSSSKSFGFLPESFQMSSLGSAHGARGVSVTSNSDGVAASGDAKVMPPPPGQPEPPQRRVRTQSRPENNATARSSQVCFETTFKKFIIGAQFSIHSTWKLVPLEFFELNDTVSFSSLVTLFVFQ